MPGKLDKRAVNSTCGHTKFHKECLKMVAFCPLCSADIDGVVDLIF